MPQIKSKNSHTIEVIHGTGVHFVFIDHPQAFPDRIAIHRKGARIDTAGAIFIEVPPGDGPTVASFLTSFIYLPGQIPQCRKPTDAMLSQPPQRTDGEKSGFSLEFYAHDWTFAPHSSLDKRSNPSIDSTRVQVKASGDTKSHTASLVIRRANEPSSWSSYDPKAAKVTISTGAFQKRALDVSFPSTDSNGACSSCRRLLHPVSCFLARSGPQVSDLVTAVSSAALCANTVPIGASDAMAVDQTAGAGPVPDATPDPELEKLADSIASIRQTPPDGKRHLIVIGDGYTPQFTSALKSVTNVGLS